MSQRGNPSVPAAGGGAVDVHAVGARALDEIAAAPDARAVDEIRARYLGRGDGLLTVVRKSIGSITDPEARRALGQTVNAVVERVTEAVEERRAALSAAGGDAGEAIDLTWPPPPLRRGPPPPGQPGVQGRAPHLRPARLHPRVRTRRWSTTATTSPSSTCRPGHHSRDTQDTFFIDDDRVLRTHTSPVQIRSMLIRGAPQRVIVPGKAYRRDYDATHFPMFFQVEGMCIDEGIALSDLKGTLEFFARSTFGADRAIRLRPHHFEFTEPSVELDVSCAVCGGEGCRLCKGSGWLEVLGAGMIHPDVLRNGGVDPERYSGFAFGIGRRAHRHAQLRDRGRAPPLRERRALREPGMKVSLDWLREYAVLDAPLDTLVQGLVDTGTEVDRVLRGPAGVVVARVVHLEPVPESTKGVLFADIDIGADEPIRVLTGAPNLSEGDLVPYAPPGTLLPGWDEPLGVRAMFGGKYQSPGMLCSAAELGLGEDAGGIHHLDHGLPGQPLHEVVALDTVLEVEVTTNRPDCLCHVGVAREMAAAVGETVREPDTAIPDGVLSAASMALRAEVAVEDDAGLPALLRAHHRERRRGSVAGLDAAPAARGRSAPHQQRRRRDQLRGPRDRPAAARLRPRPLHRRPGRRQPGGQGGGAPRTRRDGALPRRCREERGLRGHGGVRG